MSALRNDLKALRALRLLAFETEERSLATWLTANARQPPLRERQPAAPLQDTQPLRQLREAMLGHIRNVVVPINYIHGSHLSCLASAPS